MNLKNESEEELEILSYLGHYTLEAICLHILCILFNNLRKDHVVRAVRLIEQLDSMVKIQAKLAKERKGDQTHFVVKSIMDNEVVKEVNGVKEEAKDGDQKEKKKRRYKVETHALGALLVEFMIERELIVLPESMNLEEIQMKKRKKGQWFIPLNVQVLCNFDLSILPIKLNLPMVYCPLKWSINPKVRYTI